MDLDDERLAPPYVDLSDQVLAIAYRTILDENRHRLHRPVSEWEVDGEHFDIPAIHAVIRSREGLMESIIPPLNRQERRRYARFLRNEKT